ncbi:MAG: DEAD/DEAH box helicase [Bacilli bacterium]
MKFNEMNLSEKTLNALETMGFETSLPIQEKAIPVILEGKNVIGEAKTGAGKTFAFGLPIFERIDSESKDLEALIISPTRELALQIADELIKLSKFHKQKVVSLVGGVNIGGQISELRRNPKIIVATPGRLLDHMQSNRINFSNIKMFVIDEVDELVKAGFKEDVTEISKNFDEKVQKLLFSATISKEVMDTANNMMETYEFISVLNKEENKNITQYGIVITENNKLKVLKDLLDLNLPKLAMIFGRTKRRADQLGTALKQMGFQAEALHGDLSQKQRTDIMTKFRKGEINILVATDVAARGIDVNNVEYVYNFDLPQEVEYYVHRIGRTGRATKTGITYSFIKDREVTHVRKIMHETGFDIEMVKTPNFEDLKESYEKKVIEKIEKIKNYGDTKRHASLAKELIQMYDAEKLVRYFVENIITNNDAQIMKLTGEPSVAIKHGNDRMNRRDKSGRRSNSNGRRNNFNRDDSFSNNRKPHRTERHKRHNPKKNTDNHRRENFKHKRNDNKNK